jgi:hypothetical protein
MAVRKVTDERSFTKGGGTVRTELWQDDSSGHIVKYAFAYVNAVICSADNGRVIGFDNAHTYPDYRSPHHAHWMGTVRENFGCAEPLLVLDRFERALKCLKQHFGRRY